MRKAGHFTDLDGMRGILACTVMLFHLGLNGLIARLTHGLIPAGAWTLCVDFFFILSGFVLFLSLERTRPTIGRYFIKRLRRLAPLFWFGTLAMLVLKGFQVPLATLIANLLIVQSLLKNMHVAFSFISLDHPGWSVPFELFLPALTLPLLPWLGRVGRRTTSALILFLLLGAAFFAVRLALGHDLPLARAGFGLGLGMMLGRLAQLVPAPSPRPLLVLALFALAILIMALGVRLPLLSALFPLLSVGCVYFGARTRTLLSTPPIQALGRWSYSIYLLHIPMLTLVGTAVGAVDNNGTLKLLVVVATIGAAALSYRFIEAPLMRGREWPAATAP